MPRGNPSPKIAITIDPQIHEMALARASEQDVSLSAYVTESIRRRLMIEDGLASMLQWEIDHGPFSDEEVAAANKKVDDAIAELEKRMRARKRRSA